MQRTFRCAICGEKMVVTGTLKGIKAAYVEWMKGHRHGDICATEIATDLGEKIAPLLAPGLFHDQSGQKEE